MRREFASELSPRAEKTSPTRSAGHSWSESESELWGTQFGCQHHLVHDPDGSKLDTCAREGRRLSFDVDARAHLTVEQDVQAARAAQLEGEEMRTLTMTDEQIAALRRTTPHFSTHPHCPLRLPTRRPQPHHPSNPKNQPSRAEARAPTSPRAPSTILTQNKSCNLAPTPRAPRPA